MTITAAHILMTAAATYALVATCWDAYLHSGTQSAHHPALHLSGAITAGTVTMLSENVPALAAAYGALTLWYLMRSWSDLPKRDSTLRESPVEGADGVVRQPQRRDRSKA